MSILKYKTNSIFPRRFEVSINAPGFRLFQFGGGIPSQVAPGRDGFAYEHLFTPQYYIPAPLPDFDLSLLKKQQTLSRPELPSFDWDSKDKGHSGTIGTVEHLINKKTSEYYDLVKDNPEVYSNTKEARQKYGEIMGLVNNKELFNKIVNEKDTNTKNWEDAKSKGLSGNTIVYDGQAVVLDENGKKTSIPLGNLQRMKDGDPSMWKDDGRGNKVPKYQPMTYEALNNYHEYNTLTNAKGELDPFQKNVSEELTGAWGDKDFRNNLNDYFSNLGNSESVKKAFGGISEGPNNTLLLSDVLKKNSSNQGQINSAIADLNNNMDSKGRDFILRKLTERNGVFTFRDPSTKQLVTKKYNLSDPSETNSAINDYLTVAAHSKLKNSNEVLVNTKEADDRTYKQAGKDIDLKNGMLYAIQNPNRFYEVQSADGIKHRMAGNEFTLKDSQSPIQEKLVDGKKIRSSVPLQNFPINTGNDYQFPFTDATGNALAVDKQHTIPANATVQVVNMAVVSDQNGQKRPILGDRVLSKQVADLESERNRRLGKAYETYKSDPQQYAAAQKQIMDGFNASLQQKGVSFQPMQAIDVITSIPENELQQLSEAKSKQRENLDHVINRTPSKEEKELYYNTVGEQPGKKVVVTKVYSASSEGRASNLDHYLGNANTPAYQIDMNLSSEQNRREEGGKIPEASRVTKTNFTFTPITINDIQ